MTGVMTMTRTVTNCPIDDFAENLNRDYVTPAMFPFILPTIKPKWIKNNKKIEYANMACAFDTESSSFERPSTQADEPEKCACIYVWTIGINGIVCMGRTWAEFTRCIRKLSEYYQTGKNRRIIVYVHNLAWDFQFIRNHLQWEDVFAMDELKPLYALTDSGIEFRCSYLQSGYSLAKIGEHLTKYHVQKMVGDLDYKLIRHSKTELTEKEIGYILGDPRVTMAYIQEQIEFYGDITKIPLTNTGVVRSYCKNACLHSDSTHRLDNKWQNYRLLMDDLTMTPEEYTIAKEAFQGGFTHCSAWKATKVYYDVDSFDFTSSYPAVMVTEKFPMGRGKRFTNYTEDQFLQWIPKYCCVFRVQFFDLESKFHAEHILSSSRCPHFEGASFDNGRIISAKMVCTTLTEVDFINMCKFYTWSEMKLGVLYRYNKGYLPTDFVRSILDLYSKKTELKEVSGQEVEYMRSKGMLNSCYGMMVTDPCRTEITYNNGVWGKEEKTPEKLNNMLRRYNTNKNRFLFYVWGVYVTAYARNNLFTGILEFGGDYIYSDTDSIKVLNVEKHKHYIEKYNTEICRKLEAALDFHMIDKSMYRPKTKKGKEKPLGVWNQEEHITRFKSLGAKRYMVEYDTGEISLTVSGINKHDAIPYLRKTYKTNNRIFKAFADDLTIPAGYSGKKIHSYIHYPQSGIVIDYTGKPGEFSELSSVHLAECEYHLSMEHNYIAYILGLESEEKEIE